jgi:small-conductance mechanosensitive channel
MFSGAGALVALLIGSSIRSWHAHTASGHLMLLLPPAAFLLLGILCVRATAAELHEMVQRRGGPGAAATIRMIVTMLGYAISVLGALGLTTYPLGHFLLGGAIVGVILGIAAQQSLGNVFAGLVLLAARPFAIGNLIRVRSGALGGEFSGTVLSMSLTYVTISTAEGVLKVPNSSVLSAAVGPYRPSSTR